MISILKTLALRCFCLTFFEKLDVSSFAEFFGEQRFEFGFTVLRFKNRLLIKERWCFRISWTLPPFMFSNTALSGTMEIIKTGG
jgi:hypothetical protein